MAGVAGPMLRQRRWAAVRFLAGLAVGGVAAGLVLAVPIYLVGSGLHHVLPRTARVALVVAIVVVLAVADLRDRTPHVWRQVPQRLIRVLPPGVLGLVWGFDLGLLFTTQKTVSLIWASIAGAILLAPAAAPVLLAVVAFTATAAVSAWSMTRFGSTVDTRMDRTWTRKARTASAIAMLLMATALVIGG